MIDFRGWVKEKTSMKKTYIDEHVKAKMRKHIMREKMVQLFKS